MMEEKFKAGDFAVLISCEVYTRSNVLPNVSRDRFSASELLFC